MKNYRGDGETVDMTLGFDVTGGVAYIIQDIVAVAVQTVKAGKRAPMLMMGMVEMPKKPTDVMPPGKAVYWDNTNKYLTTTSSSNKKFGYTVESAASGDTTVTAYLYALS